MKIDNEFNILLKFHFVKDFSKLYIASIDINVNIIDQVIYFILLKSLQKMGNQIAPLGVDYTQANALGDTINLPYFYASFSNNLLSGSNKIFDRISVPGFTLNKKRAMTRSYSQDDRPIVPPWGQRRLKRSSTNNAEISRAQQEDEVMRGKEIFRVYRNESTFYICYIF